MQYRMKMRRGLELQEVNYCVFFNSVTSCVLGTMVNQMKNHTVDIEVLIYQNTQCISI